MNKLLMFSFALLVGCSGEIGALDDEPADPAPVTTEANLAVTPVAWNPRGLVIDDVEAVVDGDDGVVLFGGSGATALASDGSMIAADATVKDWSTASLIPAQLGGEWKVGVDKKGTLHRVRENGALESISSRYGLENDRVTAVVSAGKGATAIAFEGGLIVAAGYGAVRQSGVDGCDLLAGGHDRVACTNGDDIVVFKVGKLDQRTYHVVGTRAVTFDAHGSLLVATSDGVWMEEERSPTLTAVFRTSDIAQPIHGMVASANRVWLAVGSELATIDGKKVTRTSGLALDPHAELLASTSGDVWVLAGGSLARYTVSLSPLRAQWESEVQPIVASVCAGCHGALSPSSKIDLSTYDRWLEKRAEIRERVLVKKDMPPGSIKLSTEQIAALQDWLDTAN